MDSYLLISGIQHYLFCPRQWGLIHLEQQWAENQLTAEGEEMHSRVHDSNSSYKKGELLSLNAMHVFSRKLQIEGCCDVVEFHQSDTGIELFGRSGLWTIMPIEYKHGISKDNDSDVLQIVAQAICLEEMFNCQIDRCALFYGKTHSREYIELNDNVRNRLNKVIEEMQQLFTRHSTPHAYKSKKCSSCSLFDICVPTIFEKETVSDYIKEHIKEIQ